MGDQLTDEIAESFKGFVWANNIAPHAARALIGAVIDRMRENHRDDSEIRASLLGQPSSERTARLGK